MLYQADIDKKEGLGFAYEMALIFQPELTREEYEAEHYKREEDEKNERIESWEGFEDEIY